MTASNLCPCGSGKAYKKCCEPFISGAEIPPTAEALMRSRYVAYTQHNNQYILDTWHSSTRPDDPTPAEDRNVEWIGLKILSTEAGAPGDDRGVVEFRARCRVKDNAGGLDESSEFIKENGRWYYVDGATIKPQKTAHLKVGRNDPCPCGSGKKYKKCCGKAA
jgi:SEC-C motif-containing protein